MGVMHLCVGHHDLGSPRRRDDGVLPTFACREDAPKVFRRYWEYTLPIRRFMADTSEEAMQVIAAAIILLQL